MNPIVGRTPRSAADPLVGAPEAHCHPDGDLRAYIDGELPAASLRQLAAHLEVCPNCRERHRELSHRAARVSALMESLSDAAPVAPAPPALPSRRRWPLVALPLAASLAIAFLAALKHHPIQRTAPPPAPIAALKADAPVVQPRPKVRHIKPRTPPPQEFVRLDDEPFETGTLVHMAAADGNLEADLIIGPDGRAHAIRVVANQ